MTVDDIHAAESAIVAKVDGHVADVEAHRQAKISEHEELLAGLRNLVASAQASIEQLERATNALRNLTLG